MIYGPRATELGTLSIGLKFKKLLSVEDALILYSHPNSFIKTLAFKKLWYSDDKSIGTKIIESFTDSIDVIQSGGCESSNSPLSEYYLEIIGYPNNTFETTERLSDSEKTTIDSLATIYELNHSRPPIRKDKSFRK